MRDLKSHLAARTLISPAAAVSDNTPIVSQVLDLAGFSQAAILITAGAIADTDATFAVLVEHGDQENLSDAAPVPDQNLTGTEVEAGFAADEDNRVKSIGYVGSKRYLRLTITPTGNAGAAFFAAIAVLSGSRFFPAV